MVAWLPAPGKQWDRRERDWTASGGSGNVKPFLGIEGTSEPAAPKATDESCGGGEGSGDCGLWAGTLTLV